MNIKQTLADWGFNAIALLGGMAGSILSIVMNDKDKSFRGGIAQMISGVFFSGYGTELIVRWWKLEEHNAIIGFFGFSLGLCGIMVAKGIMKVAKKFENNPFKIIKKEQAENDTIN